MKRDCVAHDVVDGYHVITSSSSFGAVIGDSCVTYVIM